MRAVQRTFPEVYESATKVTSQELENTKGSVVVDASDFEHALINLTPSNRRHVSQYDLVSLQKPQGILYDRQACELRSGLISKNLKRNIVMDASGKATWQVLDPLVIKVLFDGAVHPESFVWRFVCGIGDGLDGFAVHPVDLLSLREDASGFGASLWRGLDDARLKGGAFCVLFKSFNGLAKDERKEMTKIMKRFMGSLVPGEPVILIYTCKNNMSTEDTESTGLIKKFRLKGPDGEQLSEYFAFILRSIYRLLSSDHALLLNESEFVLQFKKPANLAGVLAVEKFRMEIGDEVRSDLEGFCSKYFDMNIVKEKAGDCGVNSTENTNSTENNLNNLMLENLGVNNEDPIDNTDDNVNTFDSQSYDDPENVLFK